jgi:hypothetical protein
MTKDFLSRMAMFSLTVQSMTTFLYSASTDDIIATPLGPRNNGWKFRGVTYQNTACLGERPLVIRIEVKAEIQSFGIT